MRRSIWLKAVMTNAGPQSIQPAPLVNPAQDSASQGLEGLERLGRAVSTTTHRSK